MMKIMERRSQWMDDGDSFPRTLPVVEDRSHGFCVDDLAARGGLVIFFGHWWDFFHTWIFEKGVVDYNLRRFGLLLACLVHVGRRRRGDGTSWSPPIWLFI